MSYNVDISPNPIQISIGSGGNNGGSPDTPKNYIQLVDQTTGDIRYAYVDNGILYITDQTPEG